MVRPTKTGDTGEPSSFIKLESLLYRLLEHGQRTVRAGRALQLDKVQLVAPSRVLAFRVRVELALERREECSLIPQGNGHF